MISYISSQSMSSSMRQSILKMQAELAASQTELSTGTYADIGQTLGARTGDSLSLQNQNFLLQTITDTNQTVTTRLSTTQAILGNLQTNAQDLLNSLIEGNGSNSNAGTIQASGKNNLQSLISSLNSTLGGDYIFSGTNTGNPAITDYYGPAAPNKAAVDSAFAAAFGMPQTNTGVSAIDASSMQSFLDTQFAPLFQGASWTANWSAASSPFYSPRV
jgi:flagellar hook-associated protein 3 FlgL